MHVTELGSRGRSRKAWPFGGRIDWRPTLLFSTAISLFILGLFYYWFAVADRYTIFLYGHLGATPFDTVTSSRYWMSGLVACGAVMLLYVTANWLIGRLAALRHRPYHPPAWRHIWAFSLPALAIGIPAITMTLNSPTLTPSLAAACVLATLIGLALALAPGGMASRRPMDLIWLVFDGLGLMPSLLLLRTLELPSRGLIALPTALIASVGGTIAGAVWLLVMTRLRAWRRKPTPRAHELCVAGLCLSYLLMPLAHHLLVTPAEYRYITTGANFLAYNLPLQLTAFLVAGALSRGATRLRARRR